MLETIQNKTKNNLSENEKKFLEQALFGLRMNYLDEVKKDEQKGKEKTSAQEDKEKEEERGKEPGHEEETKDQSASNGLGEEGN
jgi:hypothetical protein